MTNKEYAKKYRKERDKYFRDHGLCTRCGARDERTASGKAWCLECVVKNRQEHAARRANPEKREAIRQSQRRFYYRRKAAGLCTMCGKPAAPDRTLCPEHLERERARKAREKRKGGS